MSAVTVLRTAPGLRATKLVRRNEIGEIQIDGYLAGKHFSVDEIAVGSVQEFAAVLDGISLDPRAFVIRGEPLPGIDRARCRRLIYTHEDGSPPTFRDVARPYVVLDFDQVPGPYRSDPRDGLRPRST